MPKCFKCPKAAQKHDHEIFVNEKTGHSFINTKAEILDFEPPENKIIIDETRYLRTRRFKSTMLLKTSAFLLCGFITGLIACFVLTVNDHLVNLKYQIIKKLLETRTAASPVVIATWFAGVLIPGMIGGLLVIYIEPKAAGGGMAAVIGYCNGINTSAALTLKIAVIKVFSVIGTISGGLAGGMEAPMVHIGACIAATIPNMHIFRFEPFKRLRTDYHKRDLVGAGIAAGIVGAFFSPLGGFIMALEEGMLFWSVSLTFSILFCSLIALLSVVSLTSFMSDCPGCMSSMHFLFFSPIKESNFAYNSIDMLLFCLQGLIAAVLGAFWNTCQTKLIFFRKKYITKKLYQTIEMFLLTLVSALIGWVFLISLSSRCIERPEHPHGYHIGELELNCGSHGPKAHKISDSGHHGGNQSGEISAIGTIISHTQANAIRFMFNDTHEFDILTLLVYSLVYFFLSCFTMGAQIAAGIFVPHILFGSIWGRLYGEVLNKVIFKSKSFRPNRFAVVGAAAQLCAVIRIPVTLTVIMVEASATNNVIFPVAIALIIATVIGNCFNHSIYHTQCFTAGMPLVESEPPGYCYGWDIQGSMSHKVILLTKKTHIQFIYNVLSTTKHNMFPIIKDGRVKKLEGTIARYILLKILYFRLFEEDYPDNYRYSVLSRRNHPPLTLDAIDVQSLDMHKIIDLEPYMNTSPYTLLSNSSINQAFNLIIHLGVRHIIIVTYTNEVVGVVTRKDVAYLREHSTMCAYHVSMLPKN